VGDRAELRAARETIAGRSVIDPLVVGALITRRVRMARSPLAGLSSRELRVLRLMAEGATNTRIATTLHVSESAVSKHVGAIFAKLGLTEDGPQRPPARAGRPHVPARGRPNHLIRPEARPMMRRF